ncbi:M67 family metallopeptidase [Candidatus Saganbacteria bacterium]|uniref:M67 family metallopeptidase n=1 Tax=Candidatus Saganbacteria bacterium TaxID=2575572 RepID=A0A9D6UNS7_UNCSA|nr:M67 family metallopeptidase [Candidatus Saganbacteria bacterium]
MFTITERQYGIIMQQAQACYPQEAGGILGGRENTILGVLPIPNKHLYDRTETFAISEEDIDTAYRFLAKHNLEYLGIYHTHPRGIPFPSAQDLSYHQKYLFIIGLQDRYNPELYAWRVENGKVYTEDIKIMSDLGVTVVDIKTGKPKLSENATQQELDRLADMIDEMIAGRKPTYHKAGPIRWDASTFSAMA